MNESILTRAREALTLALPFVGQHLRDCATQKISYMFSTKGRCTCGSDDAWYKVRGVISDIEYEERRVADAARDAAREAEWNRRRA